MDFSFDGTLLISGGADKTIRVWSLNQGRNGGWSSTVMATRHERTVSRLAFSPDKTRIFSGGCDGKIFIHSACTLVKSINKNSSFSCISINNFAVGICSYRNKLSKRVMVHPQEVNDISFQCGTNGLVFATACGDGILRLFDTRCSSNGTQVYFTCIIMILFLKLLIIIVFPSIQFR